MFSNSAYQPFYLRFAHRRIHAGELETLLATNHSVPNHGNPPVEQMLSQRRIETILVNPLVPWDVSKNYGAEAYPVNHLQ